MTNKMNGTGGGCVVVLILLAILAGVLFAEGLILFALWNWIIVGALHPTATTISVWGGAGLAVVLHLVKMIFFGTATS